MRRMNVVGIVIGIVAAVSTLIFACINVDAQMDDLESWYDYIDYVCEQKDICSELVQATIERESRWNPKAVNGDCMGLMQISERWHRERMERLGVTDLFDPYDNILVGVDYMAELFEKYEDAGMILMIYNGDSRVKDLQATGNLSEYAEWILTRSAELEREHGK